MCAKSIPGAVHTARQTSENGPSEPHNLAVGWTGGKPIESRETEAYDARVLRRLFHRGLRMLYSCHEGAICLFNWMAAFFYYEPLFRGRCESIGKRFSLVKMPFVKGHTRIYIGDDVR